MSEEISTFNLCKWIRKALLTRTGEVLCYKSWSNDYCVKNIREALTKLPAMERFRLVDPNDLTLEETRDLGFGTWSDESGLMLIPIYLAPFLVDEFQGASINDEKVRTIKHKEKEDTDHRFGCLAYGVIPAKLA